MLKHFTANPAGKRWAVFGAVFVMTCLLIGIQMGQPVHSPAQPQPLLAADAQLTGAQAAVEAQTAVQAQAVMGTTIHQLSDAQFLAPHYDASSHLTALEPQDVQLAPVPYTRPAADPQGFVYIDIPMSLELQQYTYQRCADLGLDYELILAIMWRESGFQVDAVGVNTNGTRDNGLMQINDVNRGWLARDYGIEDLMDPYQNIDAGTAILSLYFDKYEENYALLAYQYGEAGMLRRRAQGVTTNELVQRALTKRDEFRAMRQEAL